LSAEESLSKRRNGFFERRRKKKIWEKVVEFMDEYFPEMKELTEKSDKENVEYGFMMCESTNKLFPGRTCKGDECELDIKDCSIGKKFGNFHTHPSSIAEPSVSDVAFATLRSHKVICIGGGMGEDRKICCYYVTPEARKMKWDLVDKVERGEGHEHSPEETYEEIRCIPFR